MLFSSGLDYKEKRITIFNKGTTPMARPLKHGLDYFPMDVNFFEDDKLQFVSSRFDEKGELISIKLLCKIFKNGYYIHWNDDAALLFAKGAGRNISPSLVNDVVNELVKRDFFHKGLFERFSILTSNGIQKRYEKICCDAKRKDTIIEPKYDVLEFTMEETPLTTVLTPLTTEESTQRKRKERKGKYIPPTAEQMKGHLSELKKEYAEQIEAFKDDQQMPEYRLMLNHLFGKNEMKKVYTNILSMRDQITFPEFKTMERVSQETGISSVEIFDEMENRADLPFTNLSIAGTAINWMRRNAKRKAA